MNSKKAITLLVLATLLLSMVPVLPVSAALAPGLEETDGTPIVGVPDLQFGDKISVTEAAGDVPSGETVSIYWDVSTLETWNGVAGKLNASAAENDGGYDIWFETPEAEIGTHWVWVKTASQSPEKIEVNIVPYVDLSSGSGLAGDKIDLEAYGFDGAKDMAVLLVEAADYAAGTANWQWDSAGGDSIGTGAGGELEFDGSLVDAPLRPGSVVVSDAGAAEDLLDDGVGGLWSDEDGSGTINAGDVEVGSINYVTGEYEIDYADAAVAPTGAITAAYDGYDVGTAHELYLLTVSGDTNDLGTYTKRVTLPTGANAKPYQVVLMDASANIDADAFTIGAVISLSATEGPSGMVVRIDGRGFTNGNTITEQLPVAGAPPTEGVMLTDGAGNDMICTILDYDAAAKPTVAGGEFSIEVYVPDMGDEDDYEIHVSDGANYATVDFELTATSSISITPDYGPQGSRVTIEGENFPATKDIELQIELQTEAGAWVADIDTVDTESDGTFSTTVRVPTQPDATYNIHVIYYDNQAPAVENIEAKETFRIGSVLVLLSDDEGEAGLEIVLTGNGFSADEKWNATLGDVTIFDDGDVDGNGLLEDNAGVPTFFVPQVEPGVYDITVLDILTGIEVIVPFTVTAATTVELSPVAAPTQYNVSISGYNWAEDVGNWEFVLFNETDEWTMTADIFQLPGAVQLGAADGTEWHAWFWLADDAQGDLDNGVYTFNITQDDDFFFQIDIEVTDEHVSAAPRKATFRIGDTVSFNLQHSFGDVAPVNGGDLAVYDPSGNLYWDGDPLNIWTEVEMWYTAPVSEQTAGGNPMILLDDAPLGTWSYEWREVGGDQDVIEDGTFEVASSSEDVVSGQVADLANQINELTADLSGVTEDFDDVKSDISGVLAVAQQAVAAANAATEAVNAVATQANNAGAAAEAAQVAAENAANAASGLTTLVYGAIGAALVAALAAIVSLMQISRRIAG